MSQKRQLKLGLFIQAVGHHVAAWRHPDINPENNFDADFYINIAKKAEAAKFDAIFFADNVALFSAGETSVSYSFPVYHFEPLTLLSTIAAHTSKIGLIATASTTYLAPYHLARKYASLDHISKGRAGWNLVTSGTDAEAANFGLDAQIGHAERYERAREYIDVVRNLWDSWSDNEPLLDKESGKVFDEKDYKVLDHDGKFFKVKGPLQTAKRPTQGHPVIVQAGSSNDGRALAAETAEIVFTAQQHVDSAAHFTQSLKDLAQNAGRGRDDLLVLLGVSIYVAETHEAAEAKFAKLQEFVDPAASLLGIKTFFDWDLTQYDIDGPVPVPPYTEGWQSRQKLFYDIAQRDNLTIRQVIGRFSGARGHWVLVGTPEEVVDRLEEWFNAGAADGFNILPPTYPNDFDDIIRLVIPELQKRGLFRTEYEGNTLREHLGLKRPAATLSAIETNQAPAVAAAE